MRPTVSKAPASPLSPCRPLLSQPIEPGGRGPPGLPFPSDTLPSLSLSLGSGRALRPPLTVLENLGPGLFRGSAKGLPKAGRLSLPGWPWGQDQEARVGVQEHQLLRDSLCPLAPGHLPSHLLSVHLSPSSCSPLRGDTLHFLVTMHLPGAPSVLHLFT